MYPDKELRSSAASKHNVALLPANQCLAPAAAAALPCVSLRACSCYQVTLWGVLLRAC